MEDSGGLSSSNHPDSTFVSEETIHIMIRKLLCGQKAFNTTVGKLPLWWTLLVLIMLVIMIIIKNITLICQTVLSPLCSYFDSYTINELLKAGSDGSV